MKTHRWVDARRFNWVCAYLAWKKRCHYCHKQFKHIGTLSNQKGFCSLKCYKVSRQQYVEEEKKRLTRNEYPMLSTKDISKCPI